MIAFCLMLFAFDGADAAYTVTVVDRSLTGAPLIDAKQTPAEYPNVFNPGWLETGDGDAGGLFVRLADKQGQHSVIAFVHADSADGDGLHFPNVTDADILRDGPPGPHLVAQAMDPRATYRPATGEYFVTYQQSHPQKRSTWISSTKTPGNLSSWRRKDVAMFPSQDDCGTCLWFPHDDGGTPGPAFAVATLGLWRGGNLSLVTSTDNLQTWQDLGVFLYTRPGKWDNATLSSGPAPVRLSDGNFLLLYNVDNKWPVDDPKPFPWFGRCALGWAILDGKNLTHVVARADAPLVWAKLPWELSGFTDLVVYTDGVRAEGNDEFTVFSGGGDSVVEAFRIKVAATPDITNDTTVAKPGPFPGSTAVFYQGLNDSACFRIPTIIQTHTGTLLAFAENRETSCSDNGKNHALVVRRSTDDGANWGPLITVRKGRVPCPGCPAAISNPNPVEVTLADGSRAVLLAFDTMNNPSVAHHGVDRQIWSYDDGLTWHNATTVAYPPQENRGALIGPSVGIQNARGTIYFSAVFGNQHFVYCSSDYGASWHASAAVSGLGECSIAFLVDAADGRIIMDCRTNAKLGRAQLVWTPPPADAAGSCAPTPGKVTFPKGLIDPGCQGSIINAHGALFLSNANTTTDRSHMTVKRSDDQGATWDRGELVWKGPAAYSQLVELAGSHKHKRLGLLFEAGEKKTYETISFTTLKVFDD